MTASVYQPVVAYQDLNALDTPKLFIAYDYSGPISSSHALFCPLNDVISKQYLPQYSLVTFKIHVIVIFLAVTSTMYVNVKKLLAGILQCKVSSFKCNFLLQLLLKFVE